MCSLMDALIDKGFCDSEGILTKDESNPDIIAIRGAPLFRARGNVKQPSASREPIRWFLRIHMQLSKNQQINFMGVE